MTDRPSSLRFRGILVLAIVLGSTGSALWFAAAQDPKSKDKLESPAQPKYGTQAVRLFHAHEYLQTHEAPDFWALMPYYTHQITERACSVASTTMVANAMRSQVELTTADELLTQERILKQVCHPQWAHDVGPEGESVTMEELGEYVRETLKLFGPRQYEVQAVRVDPRDKGLRERIRKMLVENERSDDDFVMVVFWQAAFTEDPEGETGHIAPLAAYDAAHERALVFDPDRQWYEPYWVPLDTLVAGMARPDPDSGKSRGYIWVRTKP